MYLVIRRYDDVRGSIEELEKRLAEGFLPILSRANGFLDYYNFATKDGSLISISVFKDEKGATESTSLAAYWVQQHLAGFITQPPKITSGEVILHHPSVSSFTADVAAKIA